MNEQKLKTIYSIIHHIFAVFMNNNGSIKFYTILKLKIGWSHFLFTTDDSNVLNLIEFIEFMINHIS